MSATEAQIQANRINAARSTGPTSALGKSISRCNSFKHGLTGGGIVQPEEDAAEVGRRSAAMLRQLKPRNEVSRDLVHRVAVLSVRLERCAEHELIAMSVRARQAAAEYDQLRAHEVEDLFDALPDRPSLVGRMLLGSAEGVLRMIEAWTDLRDDLDAGRWRLEHGPRLVNLRGYKADDCHALAWLDDAKRAQEGDESAWLRVAQVIEAELAMLKEIHDGFDHDACERARRESVAYSRLAPTPEAVLSRRYEAAAEREMFRALKEARLSDASPTLAEQMGGEPPDDADAILERPATSAKSGSFGPVESPAPDPAQLAALSGRIERHPAPAYPGYATSSCKTAQAGVTLTTARRDE